MLQRQNGENSPQGSHRTALPTRELAQALTSAHSNGGLGVEAQASGVRPQGEGPGPIAPQSPALGAVSSPCAVHMRPPRTGFPGFNALTSYLNPPSFSQSDWRTAVL